MNKITYIVMDVDGTLTDSGVYYDENGNELKKFSTKDGTGIVAAKYNNIKLVVLTGRECKATTRRMEELGVDFIFQNIKDKHSFLLSFINEKNIARDQIAYIGDDVNDLVCMKLCGFIGCPADSCKEVLEISNYVSKFCGGHGAVRDVIEYILRDNSLWDRTINNMYKMKSELPAN